MLRTRRQRDRPAETERSVAGTGVAAQGQFRADVVRTTFRLLLTFAAARTGKTPSALDITDLDAPLIGPFLDHLESQRGNQTRTRNNRLAAIHSLFGYAALRHPEHAATIQRVLAIPTKRCDRNLVTLAHRGRGRRATGRTRPRHLDRAA